MNGRLPRVRRGDDQRGPRVPQRLVRQVVDAELGGQVDTAESGPHHRVRAADRERAADTRDILVIPRGSRGVEPDDCLMAFRQPSPDVLARGLFPVGHGQPEDAIAFIWSMNFSG